MRVLVGCEYSGRVRQAFRDLGHDAWSCDFLDAEDGSPYHIKGDVVPLLDQGWDIGIFHPPCLVAGTMVLTTRGYIPIEQVMVGDEVLTHVGRWRKVTKTMSSFAPTTTRVRVTGSPWITTTPDHPFLLHDRGWVKAAEMRRGDRVTFHLPPEQPVEVSYGEMWLYGRYVADGHVRVRGGRVEEMTLSVGLKKMDEALENCRPSRVDIDRTAARLRFYGHARNARFLQFGRGAGNKLIPGWVLQAPRDHAGAFLAGYMAGDGHDNGHRKSASTVSPTLARGIALLARRVYGRTASVQVIHRNPTTVIEGRVVNQRDSWSVHLRSSDTGKSVAIYDGDTTHNRVLHVEKSAGAQVFNLSVDEDESYTVEACVVHNCTFLSGAAEWCYKDDPGKKMAPGVLFGAARRQAREEALDFVRLLMNAPIPGIAVENPVGVIGTRIRKADQIIQPWWFGDDASKKTCLWLKNLPPLVETNRLPGDDKTRRGNQTASGQNKLGPSPDRWKERSRTYPGIAAAMALQWGGPLQMGEAQRELSRVMTGTCEEN